MSEFTAVANLIMPGVTTSVASIASTLSAAAVRTDAELTALGEEWEQLLQSSRSSNVFLTFQWISQWWVCMGRGHELFVVAVRDQDGRLVGVAPLYISRQAGALRIRRLGFLGDSLVGSDYLDVLMDEAKGTAVLQCLSSFILGQKKDWDYIDLADTLAESNAARLCEKLVTSRMNAEVIPSSICPYIVLPGTVESYLNSLGSKTRKRLRYNLRSLQREGNVEFAIATSGAELERAYEQLLNLHRARLGTRGRASAFVEPRVAEFHRKALDTLASEGRVRIYLLKLNGESIAALYALSASSRMSFYQSGMNPAYGRFSVGSLLIQYAIEDAIQSQLSEFDFLRGDEQYKLSWTSHKRQMYCVRVFDNRLKSRVAHARQIVRTSLKNCKAILFAATSRKPAGE